MAFTCPWASAAGPANSSTQHKKERKRPTMLGVVTGVSVAQKQPSVGQKICENHLHMSVLQMH